MAKEKAQLPLEVSEKYSIVGDFSRRHYFGEFGDIDFNTLTTERCAALMHGGFPYLEKKNAVEILVHQVIEPTVSKSELEVYLEELETQNPFLNIEAQVKKK